MRFQYFSDVHTEFFDVNIPLERELDAIIEAKAPYLILAGDIGDPFSQTYTEFLEHVSPLFEYIFLVSGNHEYYCFDERLLQNRRQLASVLNEKWTELVEAQIRDVCARLPNVIFLQNSTFHIPNSKLSLFGATLWSNILDSQWWEVESSVKDFTSIPGWSVPRARLLHHAACNSLQTALLEHPDRRFVVVTHHLPSTQLINPFYKNSPINSAYASDLPWLSDREEIVAWFAGHTHCAVELGKFHVNPIGYKGEMRITTKDFNKVVDVDIGSQHP